MIYIFILLLLLILCYHYDIRGYTRKRKFWFIVVQIIFILLAGLRYRLGFDTGNYIHRFYNVYPSLTEFKFSDYNIGGDGPLYVFLNVFVKSLGGRFFIVQLLQATFVITLIFNYINRHTKYVFTCALFYLFICFVQFNYEIMRGSMSIAVALYANDYVCEKKWGKAYMLYVVALLFHVQAFFLFFIPLLMKLRLNKMGVVFLICCYFGGFIVQENFGNLVSMISFYDAVQSKAASYVYKDIYNSAGGNLNFYIVYIFPNFLYTLLSLIFLRNRSHSSHLLTLEPFVMMGLGFLLLQMNLQILSRFVDYFRVYFVIYISEYAILLLKKLRSPNQFKLIKAFIWFLPFFFLTCYQYHNTYMRIIPYNSVLNRKIDKPREKAAFNPASEPANLKKY